MFGGLKNLGALMQNFGQIKQKAEQLRENLEQRTVSAESGGGAVRVTLTGKGKVREIYLDAHLLAGLGVAEDKAMVEELIASAFNAAMEKVQQLVAEEITKLSGGMDLSALTGLMK